MPFVIGSRLGAHEILGHLGTGGMGEVYRAQDTKLHRQVAIKVLPEGASGDADRLTRFHREAQAVAALNHPHIAAIYDLAESGGTTYLVLELVEGQTLAERLAAAGEAGQARGLPVDETLQIATQILEALEAAHEKGICHRDLKPANIKLTPDGSVKVLDFGLAKFLDASPAAKNLTHSPTLSLAGTYPGMILGTAGYMAPEQAKGFEADQRSDLFSFGCILYELLTGRQAFEGETASEILASVIKSEVDWTRLPARLNPRLVELLRRCLEKNPKKRWYAAGDVRVEIEALRDRAVVEETSGGGRTAAQAPRPWWRPSLPLAAAAILAASAAWTLKPSSPAPAPPVTRFTIALPDKSEFTNTGRRVVDISPDGTTLAYVADYRLHVRHLDALEPRVVAGDGRTTLFNPAFSPDGQSMAFIAGRDLRRVAVTGGAPVTLAEVGSHFGMRWDEHGIVIGQGSQGIVRVPPDGGAPEVIATAGANEMLGSPQILPGGRVLLYAVKRTDETWDEASIAVQPLAGGARTILVRGGTDGRYLPTGHLVYTLNGVLLAVPFDLERLAVTGGPVPVVEGVRRGTGTSSSGSAHLGLSAAGTLVYAPGPVGADNETGNLALFDRKGQRELLNLPASRYASPRVSPDGKFVALEVSDGKESFVAVYELSGASALRRLTFGGNNRGPVWSPDGRWIAFQSDREGDPAVFRQRADGAGTPERLTRPEPDTEHMPEDWSPDGQHLLVTVAQAQQYYLTALALKDGTMAPFADARSPGMINAAFSPDGRWVAYQVREEDGEISVYVQPFPSPGAKYLLPVPGSGHPTWSPDGGEILVNSGPGSSTITAVKATPSFTFGPPRAFPRTGRTEGPPFTSRANIDFLPDGQRIIGVTTADGGAVVSDELIVVLNWHEELKRRVPVR